MAPSPTPAHPANPASPVTHTGACHCGAVRFTVTTPSPHLTAWDCSCSICSVKRNVHVIVPEGAFTLEEGGEAALTTYRFGTGVARHRFCSVCGVQAFYHPRSNPDGVAVTVACIHPGTVASVTTKPFDGRDWEAAYLASGIAESAPR